MVLQDDAAAGVATVFSAHDGGLLDEFQPHLGREVQQADGRAAVTEQRDGRAEGVAAAAARASAICRSRSIVSASSSAPR